jgi:hypothetical protein
MTNEELTHKDIPAGTDKHAKFTRTDHSMHICWVDICKGHNGLFDQIPVEHLYDLPL